MPNWLTHIRIAEAVINIFDFPLNAEIYYVGSIAADCGDVLFNKEGKKYYNPPRYISHWTDDISQWDSPIHFERFHNKYIVSENNLNNKSFYWGYYVHLLTDAIWIELVSRPVIESFETPQEYSEIARDLLRSDWYHTEVEFLQKNPNYYPLEIIKSINNFENIYLDYASSDIINQKLKILSHSYNLLDIDGNTKYSFFTPEDYENIVITIKKIVKMNIVSRE